MQTLDERVDALEVGLLEMNEALRDLKAGQLRAADQIRIVGEEQSKAVRDEGARVTEELLAQSQAILKVSQAMTTLQGQVQKWTAAGSLVGAVMLFIAVRILGLG
jgi:hypothetical protein